MSEAQDQQLNGILRVPVVFVNAYLVDIHPGDPSKGWMLIDTGLRNLGHAAIRQAAAARYGDIRPRAIVLTHGHFDHSGSASSLASTWQCAVYAHRLELPYLTGRSEYAPPDPTVGGALAQLSRTFPRRAPNLTSVIQPLADDGSIPAVPAWRAIHTPGHTPGHVSLYREWDQTLIAGDALATMNQESWTSMITMTRTLRWPPAPLTTDWRAARDSVEELAALGPRAIAAGHGLPLTGPDVAARLTRFAGTFTAPSHGRYVRRPVSADALGVVGLPPRVPDRIGGLLRGAAVAGVVGGVYLVMRRNARAMDVR